MIDEPLDEALSIASEALAGRQRSPLDSLAAASSIVERDDASAAARIVGYWAMGAAERELSRLADAEEHMRAAIALAVEVADEQLAAQVSSALVAVLGARGRGEEALALAESVEQLLPPMERADLDMKRATVLEDMGRVAEAVDAYTDALATIELGPDRVLEARLRCNRAVALAYQGRIEEALDDSTAAERLATAHEHYFLAGGAAHNHAFAAGLQGDIVTALASFVRADSLYEQVGYPGRSAGVLASDRCELMLAAGLNDEARANAEIAVSALADGGDTNNLAEARLLLARACLAQGDVDAAHREALVALAEFRQANRDGWAAMAEYVAVRALQVSPTAPPTDLLGRADAIAGRLERLGWTSESASVRVSSAELAVEWGDTAFARSQLMLAARARDHGRPDRRASAWLATAMLRRSELDRGGARRAVTAGLDLLARHQTSLGATDLRVGATTHARRLAELGLEMALESRRPRDVLVWAERVRANA
ncbi:MAG: tetratricopeptide repeat protein, partial [Ilumatobacteraceae bacterium]